MFTIGFELVDKNLGLGWSTIINMFLKKTIIDNICFSLLSKIITLRTYKRQNNLAVRNNLVQLSREIASCELRESKNSSKNDGQKRRYDFNTVYFNAHFYLCL